MLCPAGEKATALFNLTKEAVNSLGLEDKVELITEKKEFSKHNVLDTPALIIEGKVVSEGKALDLEVIKDLIIKA